MNSDSQVSNLRRDGFTLVEMLVVLAILSIITSIMVLSVDGSRRAGLAAQAESAAQQKVRVVYSLLERDVRDIASGLFSNTYRRNNGGEAGELLGNQNPDQFNYTIEVTDLEGFMVPPLEILNGTNNESSSYLNPLHQTINLTSDYREPGSDILSIYYLPDSVFSGLIDEYTGMGQENFSILDPIVGQRMLDAFVALGSNPILVMVIDDEGMYATFRVITSIVNQAGEYLVKMEPSNSVNQPANFKAFLESLGYSFSGPGGPERLRSMMNNDFFGQVSAVSYFLYRHPDPALEARGWLVRLDMPAIATGELDIDATDPETIRPFVIAENIAEFQLAMGIDSDENGIVDPGEWHNAEDMETYSHGTPGEGSVSAEFSDMINNLKEIRLTVVSYTDNSSEDDPYGFMKLGASGFSTSYSSVGQVAEMIGIAPQIEDHIWTRDDLLDRLWYHRAVPITRRVKVRNLDLGNMFARPQ